ncbi:HTH-type transcriptional activator RhaR [Kutzneria sp. CA-103260]|nr:HTH-type transcriptional activator RhaR [Kutzneria sp. CA-103260]
MLAVKIDSAALHTQLERLVDAPVSTPPQLAPQLDVTSGAGRSWAELAKIVAADAHNSHALVRHPVVAGRLQEALITGLLLAVDHSYHETLTRPAPPCRPAPVKRAIDAIEAEPAYPFTAAALADVARVSVRRLQQGFQQHVTMSPMSYLRQVRLARVHDELRMADPGCFDHPLGRRRPVVFFRRILAI